jgi:hypothetical protein
LLYSPFFCYFDYTRFRYVTAYLVYLYRKNGEKPLIQFFQKVIRIIWDHC